MKMKFIPNPKVPATIGRFRLHQFCRRFLKDWSLCVLVVFWRDLGSCLLTSTHTGRDWVPVMLFLTSSVLVSWNKTGVESLRSSRLISVRPLTGLIMGALCLNCGKLELVAWSWRFSRIFCPVVLRELRLMVCLVQVLISYLVCHRVVFLVHCCFCCTLLTFQGCFRMSWLVMRTTLPCFVGYHILVIGHPWQHRWMRIWLSSAIGAVGGAC